jgi:hypothetical protein
MGAIADFDQLVNTLTGGTAAREQMWIFYDNRSGAAAGPVTSVGRFTSMWTFNHLSSVGAAPGGTARNPDRTTAGALGQADPTGGRSKYLCGIAGSGVVAGTFILYDRLGDISGLNGTTITAQTCNVNTTRYTSTASVGNRIYIEIYTAVGGTSRTITCSYTNQDGTSGRTSPAVAIGGTGLSEVARIIQVPFQAGDTGVQSVESVTLSATTGAAGNFGVTIGRPIAMFPLNLAGATSVTDLISQIPSLPEIQTGACLTMMMQATTTTSPNFFGTLSFVEA